MIDLNDSTLPSLGGSISIPAYDRSRVRPGIVHVGVGNFHRVHQAPIIDDCLAQNGNEGWGICGVGLTEGEGARRKARAYAEQNGLYTVAELTTGAQPVRVIGAMVDYIHAPTDPEAVVRRLAHPDTRIVSLTITEGGYNLDEASGAFQLDQPDVASDLAGARPRSAFGFIVAGLRARRTSGAGPFTVMSCDNLARNGDASRTAVVSFAKAVDPDLANWIEERVTFPNSMVDRIAPQIPEGERRRLNEASGIDDALPATCETYTSWVIEDRFAAGRPALEIGGVQFRDDAANFVEVKGRLSNAAHVLMAFPSILMGHRLVHDGMRDHRIERLLRQFWDRDTLRLIEAPLGYSTEAFVRKVVERFADPAINDQLLRVASEGSAKINVFHGKTIRTMLANGADMTREAFLFATFWRFLQGHDDEGKSYEVRESRFSGDDWALLKTGDPLALLRVSPFRGLSLDRSTAFVRPFLSLSEMLRSKDCSATLERILSDLV